MISRRGLLRGILAAGMAPAVVKAGILMPSRALVLPAGGVWSMAYHTTSAEHSIWTKPPEPMYEDLDPKVEMEGVLRDGEIGRYEGFRFITTPYDNLAHAKEIQRRRTNLFSGRTNFRPLKISQR